MSEFANNTTSSFLAGGLSTALAMTCVAPVVTINVRMMHDNPKTISSGNVVRYTGMVDCFTHIAREQGIKAFWRGNLINVIRFSPSHAFSFAFKDGIKGFFPKADKNAELGKFFMINMASGGLAGATSPLVIYPLDFARNRLVTDGASGTRRSKAQFNGIVDCIMKTVASGGIRALYHGYGISVMGIIPYRAVYFGLFDTLSGYNPFQKDESNSKRTVSKLICAQTSAITATYISYPFDTVRRRLQMQSDKPSTNTGRLIYNGIYDCLIKIIRNEGASALFKGVRRTGSNLHTVSAALALVFFSELTVAESS